MAYHIMASPVMTFMTAFQVQRQKKTDRGSHIYPTITAASNVLEVVSLAENSEPSSWQHKGTPDDCKAAYGRYLEAQQAT